MHTHSRLNPNRLTASQIGHLLHVRKVELALVRAIVRREHVLLPRLPQQSLHGNNACREAIWSTALASKALGYPASVDENSRTIAVSLKRRDYHVTILPITRPRPDEHLLVMSEASLRRDSAVVEFMDCFGVDPRREGEWLAEDAVLELCYQVGFPA
jgi:hypothetical protein